MNDTRPTLDVEHFSQIKPPLDIPNASQLRALDSLLEAVILRAKAAIHDDTPPSLIAKLYLSAAHETIREMADVALVQIASQLPPYLHARALKTGIAGVLACRAQVMAESDAKDIFGEPLDSITKKLAVYGGSE